MNKYMNKYVGRTRMNSMNKFTCNQVRDDEYGIKQEEVKQEEVKEEAVKEEEDGDEIVKKEEVKEEKDGDEIVKKEYVREKLAKQVRTSLVEKHCM